MHWQTITKTTPTSVAVAGHVQDDAGFLRVDVHLAQRLVSLSLSTLPWTKSHTEMGAERTEVGVPRRHIHGPWMGRAKPPRLVTPSNEYLLSSPVPPSSPLSPPAGPHKEDVTADEEGHRLPLQAHPHRVLHAEQRGAMDAS